MTSVESEHRLSIRAVIEEERALAAFYAVQLSRAPTHAWAPRWRALRAWHRGQVTKWRKELRKR